MHAWLDNQHALTVYVSSSRSPSYEERICAVLVTTDIRRADLKNIMPEKGWAVTRLYYVGPLSLEMRVSRDYAEVMNRLALLPGMQSEVGPFRGERPGMPSSLERFPVRFREAAEKVPCLAADWPGSTGPRLLTPTGMPGGGCIRH